MKKELKKEKAFTNGFEKFTAKVVKASGSQGAVIVACCVILGWAVTGPLFHFSDTWQLVINTSTTIITFVMVFIIQHSQNKDTTAIQLKLNELIAVNYKASNRLVNIEDLTDEELAVLKKFYVKLSDLAESEKDLYSSHSIDEAEENHRDKKAAQKED